MFMKVLIVYDTFYGNTQKVAEMVKDALAGHEVNLIKIDVLTQEKIDETEMIVFGTPTRAFNMTKKVRRALKKYKYQDKLFWAFDTRANVEDLDNKFLLKMINRFGYAAEKIEKMLLKKGAVKKLESSWYFVKDSEGPLYEDVQEKIKTDLSEIL